MDTDDIFSSLSSSSQPDQQQFLKLYDDVIDDVQRSAHFDGQGDSAFVTGKAKEGICPSEAIRDTMHLQSDPYLQHDELFTTISSYNDAHPATTDDGTFPVTSTDDGALPVTSAVQPECMQHSSTYLRSETEQQQFNSSCDPIASPLLIYYQNVRGLRSKISEFLLEVSDSPYDCIVLTETWLDSQICSVQLFGTEYSVYRSDRCVQNSAKAYGGGVLVAVRKSLSSALLTNAMDESLEHVWVMIKSSESKIAIGAIYIPPNLRNESEVIDRHISSIEKVHSLIDINDDLLLFGDYNRSGLSWLVHPQANYLFVDALHSSVSVSTSRLLDGMAFHNLFQINPIHNRNGRFLDLIFANQQALLACSVETAPDSLCKIDVHHPPLMVAFNRRSAVFSTDEFDPNDFDFRRGNYDAINEALRSVDWTSIDRCSDPDDAVTIFTGIIHDLVHQFVPKASPPRKPVWGNNFLNRLNRLRKSALRTYRKNKNPANRNRFTVASRSYKALNKRLYKSYVRKTERNLRLNPKSFWRFVNTKRREDGLPSSMFLLHKEASNCSSKCDLFAEHFTSIFNSECASPEAITGAMLHVPNDVLSSNTFIVSADEVAEAVSNLKMSFRPGPDGIPAVFLKKCHETLISPLLFIFNLSLQRQKFPCSWKSSFMFPVFKKGDKRNIEHYRGITSLCACSKVLEAVVFKHLMFDVKSYISTAQHGFYPGRSVSTNLLEFTSYCLRGMDRDLQIDAVYTDLKAAFDRVDHGILLAKLEKLGTSVGFVVFLESYLRNRRAAVKLGTSQSDWFSNNSGVPQGSILGPLLFSLFINDVTRTLPPGTRLLYADDTKIYKSIRTSNDCLELQKLINLFTDWCNYNFLTISISKCTVISFSRKKQPLVYEYRIADEIVLRSNVVSDLGVILDEKLSFRQHYSMITNKANRQLGVIMRIGKEFDDPGTLKALYCSLVRSILESACVVWNPYYDYWNKRIECIQKRFVRRVCRTLPWRNPDSLPPYENLCLLLGLASLEQRRRDILVRTAHKILTGIYDCPAILATLHLNCPHRPQRHQRLLRLDVHRTNYALHEPIRRMAQEYNRSGHNFNF